MTNKSRRWIWAFGLVGVLVVGLWLALPALLPDERQLADRLAAEAEQRLGVPVKVGALRWRLFPQPVVRIENAQTVQPQPLQIETLTAYPALWPLLRGQLVLRRIDVDGAVLAQVSLSALEPPANKSDADSFALKRLQFANLRWIPRHGPALPLEGEVEFAADGRPEQAELRRSASSPAARLRLQRTAPASEGNAEVYQVQIAIGGGSADGQATLTRQTSGQLQLAGQLQPRNVEINNAMAALGRTSPISGSMSGQTTLSASADSLPGLARALQTQTRFAMENALMLRFDLDKAVRSAGRDTAGQTPLQNVSGQLDTQNTGKGIVARYTQVKASAGNLVASGQATLAQRRINAEFAIDLVDGVVGIPLKVNGPYESPQVSVPPGALAGAVVGTAVLPGVGTAIGARIGATLGKIFSPGPEPSPGRKPSAPASK